MAASRRQSVADGNVAVKPAPDRFRIVLRRRNGRFVRILDRAPSTYAAKRLAQHHAGKYDDGYYVEVEPTENPIEDFVGFP
jgi:hypothetical protein